MTVLLIALGVLAALYLLIILGAALGSLRPPRVPLYLSPGIMGYPFEPVEIVAADGVVLRGWWVPHPEAKGVLLGLHGYVMNRCEWAAMLPVLRRAECSCLFMDLRGQGRSGRARVTFGRDEADDARLAMDWCRQRSPGLPLVVMGSSMGAAAAVFGALEANPRPDGLILDGVYRRFDEAGRGWWIMLAGKWLDVLLKPVVPLGSLLAGIKPKALNVEAVLPRLQDIPMLFCCGTRDPIVPFESAKRNVEAAGPLAQLAPFEGAGHGHGRFREPERFNQLVTDFLTLIYIRSQCNNSGNSDGHNDGALRQGGHRLEDEAVRDH